MSDEQFREDELVSAYLDGEATPGEIAEVEQDDELMARVEQLRAVRDAVAAPTAPVSEELRDRMISVALAVADAETTPRPQARVVPFHRRHQTRFAVAAAVILLAAVAGAGLIASRGGEDSQMAVEASASVEAATAAAPAEAEEEEMAASGPATAEAERAEATAESEGSEMAADAPTTAETAAAEAPAESDSAMAADSADAEMAAAAESTAAAEAAAAAEAEAAAAAAAFEADSAMAADSAEHELAAAAEPMAAPTTTASAKPAEGEPTAEAAAAEAGAVEAAMAESAPTEVEPPAEPADQAVSEDPHRADITEAAEADDSPTGPVMDLGTFEDLESLFDDISVRWFAALINETTADVETAAEKAAEHLRATALENETTADAGTCSTAVHQQARQMGATTFHPSVATIGADDPVTIDARLARRANGIAFFVYAAPPTCEIGTYELDTPDRR